MRSTRSPFSSDADLLVRPSFFPPEDVGPRPVQLQPSKLKVPANDFFTPRKYSVAVPDNFGFVNPQLRSSSAVGLVTSAPGTVPTLVRKLDFGSSFERSLDEITKNTVSGIMSKNEKKAVFLIFFLISGF